MFRGKGNVVSHGSALCVCAIYSMFVQEAFMTKVYPVIVRHTRIPIVRTSVLKLVSLEREVHYMETRKYKLLSMSNCSAAAAWRIFHRSFKCLLGRCAFLFIMLTRDDIFKLEQLAAYCSFVKRQILLVFFSCDNEF